MNWKANTSNSANTYDSQITVTGSTLTSGDSNWTMNITNTNTNMISSFINICKKMYSFFNFQNIDANLISMNFKANDANTTNATDATITVLGVGNTSADNTGIMNLYAGGVNVTPATSGGSFFSFKNTAYDLLTLNFKANDSNTFNTTDSSMTCVGTSENINNSGTLGLVTRTTNISQAPTQLLTTGSTYEPYSYIQCINYFSNKVSMYFKANNNNNLNLCDGSIIVAPITGNDLAVNNNGIMEIQADVTKIGTQKLTTVGTGSSHIYIGDENSDIIILGKLSLTNSAYGTPSYFNQVRNRAP